VRPPAGTYDPALDAARRAAADVNRAYTRTGEDYASNTAMLRRQYDILAGRQQEQANVSGVISGGALLEAAAKRRANQAVEQAPLDTGYQRAGQEHDLAIQRLGVGFQRGVTDRGTALTRAGREDRAFGLDTAAERLYQASQAGWVPPRKPRRRK
jgi:hypothetical protein